MTAVIRTGKLTSRTARIAGSSTLTSRSRRARSSGFSVPTVPQNHDDSRPARPHPTDQRQGPTVFEIESSRKPGGDPRRIGYCRASSLSTIGLTGGQTLEYFRQPGAAARGHGVSGRS